MTKTECLKAAVEKATGEGEPLPQAVPQILTKVPASRKYEKGSSRKNGERIHTIGQKQKPMRMENGIEV